MNPLLHKGAVFRCDVGVTEQSKADLESLEIYQHIRPP